MTNKELDKWVGEHIFGWRFNPKSPDFYKYEKRQKGWCYILDKPFSDDISLAFRVVETMREKGYEFTIRSLSDPNRWECWIEQGFDYEEYVEHKDLSMAICLAAKKAIEGEIE